MLKVLKHNQEVKRYNSFGEFPLKINIPSCQRDLQEFHVNNMRQHIRDRYDQQKEPIFGALDIVKYNNMYYIVDGNHRYNALKLEYEKNKLIVPFNCIIYITDSSNELEEIFKTRNKNLPVPDFILNPGSKNKALLEEIQRYIGTLSYLFNNNSNRPNVNVTRFINNFADSRLFDLVNNIEDFKKILNIMNNIAYRDITKSDLAESTINRCKSEGLFIGIYKQMPWFNDNYDLSEFRNTLLK